MPARPLMDAVYGDGASEVFGALIRIESDQLDEPILVTDIFGGWEEEVQSYTLWVGGERYFCLPLQMQPPGQSDKQPKGSIMLPSVDPTMDPRIAEAIDAMLDPAELKISVVVRSDPTLAVSAPLEGLQLRNVRGKHGDLMGDLAWPSLEEEPYPQDWQRPEKFRASWRSQP